MPEGALPKGGWFICFCLGFIAGVALYPFLYGYLTYAVICLVVNFLLLEILAFIKKKVNFFIALICCFLGLVLGAMRYDLAVHYPTKQDLDYYLNQTIEFSGVVVSEPSLKVGTVELDVRAEKFSNGQLARGIVRLRTSPWPEFFYGDKVNVNCKLQAPENTEFNYQRYLANYGIYSLCFKARLKKIDNNSTNFIAYLINFKQAIIRLIKTHVNEPEASLIGPVIFGGGEGIDDDIVLMFRRTGLTHIMAVSGFNVSILALGLAYILFAFGLSRPRVFIFSSLGIVVYVLMVAWPASAVRAGVMSILLLYSLVIGRPTRIINLIIITATGTLVFNPLYLAADIGWQLSFLALLGLIYLQPLIKRVLVKVFLEKLNWLAEILAATVAAQIATTPVTLYNFGQVSLISPLANILVVWLIPVFTAVTIIALPLAALMPSLGDIMFLPSFFLAKYIIGIVTVLAKPDWVMFSV